MASIPQYNSPSVVNHHTNERSPASSRGGGSGLGYTTRWFTIKTNPSANTVTMLANRFTTTPSGQRGLPNGGERRPPPTNPGGAKAHRPATGHQRRGPKPSPLGLPAARRVSDRPDDHNSRQSPR